MGTYNLSEYELFMTLKETLDNIEGDFKQSTLINALSKLKYYPHTSDISKEYNEKHHIWDEISKEEFFK